MLQITINFVGQNPTVLTVGSSIGFDAPTDEDPVWRFWIEIGNSDGFGETISANLSEKENEYIKELFYKYKK